MPSKHTLSLLVTSAAAAAVVAACSAAKPPEPESAGAELYVQNCASCHGQDAGGLRGPSLRTGLSAEEVSTAVTEGRGGQMPSFRDRLGPEQIQTLADYIQGIGADPDAGT